MIRRLAPYLQHLVICFTRDVAVLRDERHILFFIRTLTMMTHHDEERVIPGGGRMGWNGSVIGMVAVGLLGSIFPTSSHAIPAFSRQYGTSCSTCHWDFPKLNDFGKAFKDAGFKFPKDDESFLKVPPIMLGAPAQAELWPKVIYPGTIPGLPPISMRYNTFFQAVSGNRDNFNAQLPAGTPGTYIPRTDFQPGYFSIFTAGNFGGGIAFWADDDISVGGANSNGGLGDGYLKFYNLGRVLKLPTDSLNLRVGQFELDLPFSPARSWNLSGWDIFDEANVGVLNGLSPQQNVNNGFAFSSPAVGAEISGGYNYRGYHYSVAVVDQNTTGISAAPLNISPANGVGFVSDSNFKDLYGRFSYRFNLERDAANRNEVQAAGASGPHDHTYLRLGTMYFYGRSVQRFSGALSDGITPAVITAREPFYRVGGDVDFNYRTFNLFGVYMAGRDQNLLPFTPAEGSLPTGFTASRAATFNGGFLEADYLALPWIMTIMRWDRVGSTADRVNALQFDPANPPPSAYFSPYSATRNRFTPGIQFLIHANIKASFEYQIRPPQVVYNPATGEQLKGSFRTNSAVAGLEWAY